MNFSLKQALKVLVVFACAVGVIGTSVMITNKNTNNAKSKNDSLQNVVDGSDSGNDDNSTPTSGPNGEPLVSKTESQVGKYTDIDGDGIVDGIIFADLMVGGNGQYDTKEESIYNIPTIASSKEYYVSQESYTDVLGGSAEVLTPVGKGNDRFYIMALKDISTKHYTWYNNALSNGNKITDYETVTSTDFGKGKSNTITMINKWNNKEYGEQSEKDLWGQIQNEVNDGWFVPSREELAAFANELKITSSNYSEKGLSYEYFGSSFRSSVQATTLNCGYSSSYGAGVMSGTQLNYFTCAVRLATTF